METTWEALVVLVYITTCLKTLGDKYGRKYLFWGQVTRQKITCKKLVDPEYLITIRPWGEKLFLFAAVTDTLILIVRQTHILKTPASTREFFINFFMHGGMGNFKPRKIANR